MDQIVEFFGNHTLLFVGFFATLGMLVFTEYTRLAGGLKSLTPFVATRMLNDGEVTFVDVRDESEFKAGHVQNARNLPLNKLDERVHEIDKLKEKPLVLYCDNGMRTSRAATKLRKNGFTQLHSLAGGLTAWEKANLPTVKR